MLVIRRAYIRGLIFGILWYLINRFKHSWFNKVMALNVECLEFHVVGYHLQYQDSSKQVGAPIW